jgi:branched-chain amino acid transport system ATP-binding protein
MALLEIQDLTKAFGGVQAVDHVTLSFEERGLTSVIGPNGAGKTTLFNLITGHLTPSDGRILFGGEDITRLPSFEIWYKGLCRSFQITSLFPSLTVFENIQLVQLTRHRKQFNLFQRATHLYKEETFEILKAIELADKANMTVSSLPYGDQRKLEIGIVLASDAKMMLLDEPTAGMARVERLAMASFIERLFQERSLSIVFIEHDMDVVMSISQKIWVMHQGRIIVEGTPEEIQRNDEVKRIYLGEQII